MRRTGLACVIALWSLSAPDAQVFKADAELVTIPVTVTDRGNERVSGLSVENFRVFEDGIEQTVALVDDHRHPVSLGIVLDSSQSMGGWKQRQAAIAVDRVIAGLQPEDEVALVVLSAAVAVAVPWLSARDAPLDLLDAGDYLALLVEGVAVSAISGAIGVGIGAIVRNQVAAVVGTLIYLFVLEPLIGLLSEEVSAYSIGGTTGALTGSPLTRSVISDEEANEIAQPVPWKRMSSILPSPSLT